MTHNETDKNAEEIMERRLQARDVDRVIARDLTAGELYNGIEDNIES